MSEETRQQRRARRREQLKAGQQAARYGLGSQPATADLVGAAQLIKAELDDRKSQRRAAAAAAVAHAVNETSLGADPGVPAVACKKGSGYCCHGYVAVTAPEVFLLAEAVQHSARRGGPHVRHVVARATEVAGLSPAERFGRKLPCPLLVDGSCSQYAARPRMCRQTAAFAVEPCLEEYEGKPGDMQVPRRYAEHAVNAQIAMLAALQASHLGRSAYALSDALLLALETPDTEARWLAGEDVFARLPAAPAEPRATLTRIEEIASGLA